MKHQALYSLQNNSKKLKSRPLQLLFRALRVREPKNPLYVGCCRFLATFIYYSTRLIQHTDWLVGCFGFNGTLHIDR